MEAARRCHRQPDQFSDHGSEAAERQALFHRCEDILLLVALTKDDPVRMQSGLGDRRKKQIGSGQAPENLARRSRGDPRDHQGGRRAVDRIRAAARELVQCTKSQAPTRQHAVDFRDTEWQDDRLARNAALEMRDALPQLGNDVGAHLSHVRSSSFYRQKRACSLFVPN